MQKCRKIWKNKNTHWNTELNILVWISDCLNKIPFQSLAWFYSLNFTSFSFLRLNISISKFVLLVYLLAHQPSTICHYSKIKIWNVFTWPLNIVYSLGYQIQCQKSFHNVFSDKYSDQRWNLPKLVQVRVEFCYQQCSDAILIYLCFWNDTDMDSYQTFHGQDNMNFLCQLVCHKILDLHFGITQFDSWPGYQWCRLNFFVVSFRLMSG